MLYRQLTDKLRMSNFSNVNSFKKKIENHKSQSPKSTEIEKKETRG